MTAEDQLVTPRLLLRPWRDDADDLDAYARLSSDPEVMRHIGSGRPLTREESAAGLARFVEHWAEHGYGLYAAILPAEDEPIGFTGLLRPSEPGVRPGDVEIGWRLARRHWGKGYATEAATAVRDHAFADLRLARLVALLRPANAASAGVARKLGMKLERETLCRRGLPMWIYGMANPHGQAGAPAHARGPAEPGDAAR